MTPACGMLCRDKIALIDVEGLIVNARTGGLFSSGDNPVSLFRERLDTAACDKRVKAVVLRINTPGGGVTASDIMYRDLVNFRQETGKPVVACLMDVAASGGYYLAVGCDRIFAHPTTVTGSTPPRPSRSPRRMARSLLPPRMGGHGASPSCSEY